MPFGHHSNRGALGLKFNWMFVAKKRDYALVTFQNIEDSEHALYTVMAHAPDEWVLDFEPFNVSFYQPYIGLGLVVRYFLIINSVLNWS